MVCDAISHDSRPLQSAQIIEAALDALPPIESREKRESANAARRRIQQMANKQRYSTTRKR